VVKAFPQSGEGGCERSEQTDEGAGKQQLTGEITPHLALRATFPPRGEGLRGNMQHRCTFAV